MRARIALAVVAAGVTLLPAVPAQAGGFCQEGRATEGTGAVVGMTNNCYTPTVLRADVGSEVTFINKDAEPHTITSAGGVWSDAHKELMPGKRITYRFEESGIYVYSCLVHPGMAGAIVVGDGQGQGGTTEKVDLSVAEDAVADAGDQAGETAEDIPEEPASSATPALPGLIGAGLVAGGAAGFGLGRRRRTMR